MTESLWPSKIHAHKTMKQTIQVIPLFLLATLAASHPVAAATKPVRIFILAGQSNMEGAAEKK